MKRITLATLAALVLAACAMFTGPARLTLYAQSVPFVAHAQWDPAPAAEGVTSYTMTLDGGAPITVAPTVDPACSCIRTPLTIPAFGSHTVAITATNLLLSTDPASGQQSSAPAVITFSLNRSPGAITGGKIGK
jgi:hypothetical protein